MSVSLVLSSIVDTSLITIRITSSISKSGVFTCTREDVRRLWSPYRFATALSINTQQASKACRSVERWEADHESGHGTGKFEWAERDFRDSPSISPDRGCCIFVRGFSCPIEYSNGNFLSFFLFMPVKTCYYLTWNSAWFNCSEIWLITRCILVYFQFVRYKLT